jgi:hypothetical protein
MSDTVAVFLVGIVFGLLIGAALALIAFDVRLSYRVPSISHNYQRCVRDFSPQPKGARGRSAIRAMCANESLK